MSCSTLASEGAAAQHATERATQDARRRERAGRRGQRERRDALVAECREDQVHVVQVQVPEQEGDECQVEQVERDQVQPQRLDEGGR